jgi:hypothetical protein
MTGSIASPRLSSTYANEIRDLLKLYRASVFHEWPHRLRLQTLARDTSVARSISAKMRKLHQRIVVFHMTPMQPRQRKSLPGGV